MSDNKNNKREIPEDDQICEETVQCANHTSRIRDFVRQKKTFYTLDTSNKRLVTVKKLFLHCKETNKRILDQNIINNQQLSDIIRITNYTILAARREWNKHVSEKMEQEMRLSEGCRTTSVKLTGVPKKALLEKLEKMTGKPSSNRVLSDSEIKKIPKLILARKFTESPKKDFYIKELSKISNNMKDATLESKAIKQIFDQVDEAIKIISKAQANMDVLYKQRKYPRKYDPIKLTPLPISTDTTTTTPIDQQNVEIPTSNYNIVNFNKNQITLQKCDTNTSSNLHNDHKPIVISLLQINPAYASQTLSTTQQTDKFININTPEKPSTSSSITESTSSMAQNNDVNSTPETPITYTNFGINPPLIMTTPLLTHDETPDATDTTALSEPKINFDELLNQSDAQMEHQENLLPIDSAALLELPDDWEEYFIQYGSQTNELTDIEKFLEAPESFTLPDSYNFDEEDLSCLDDLINNGNI
jgi:hypothetical protein